MHGDDVAAFAPEPEDDLDSAQETLVDVLILTALKDELDGVLGLGHSWTKHRDARGFPYHRCTFPSGLHVAAAWIGEMGQTAAMSRGKDLVRELSPECLAMCGICAGDLEQVSLGDLIVADRLWTYDEGKQVENKFYHSMKMVHVERTWGMDVAFAKDWLDLRVLAEGRPPSKEMQIRWLLHTLHAHQFDDGPAPTDHPDRKTRCPAFADIVKAAMREKLVAREGRSLLLLDAGKDRVDEDSLLHPDGVPSEKAHAIHIGAMATGSAVIKDDGIFPRLRAVVRETMALDMEGAAIAQLADDEQKKFLVVKAVQDYANKQKDDTYRAFGCRASAKFLLAFLERHLEPRRAASLPKNRFDIQEREWERENPFVRRVEQAAALRHPNAKITRRRVSHPFAGALELRIDQDFLDTAIVVALDGQLNDDVWRLFCSEIQEPARRRDPSVRLTLVHRGETNPSEMFTDAAARRIALRTFHEYQGLFDLKPYLEWQTNRLLNHPVYPPDLYIDAPAEWQVSGSREWALIDNALEHLWKLLGAREERRFALVLGDFGAGKTFLLRELARRMHLENHGVWPVLLEMHLLEKRHDLNQLLAAHFARADVVGYNFRAFQYMLNEGRIALLFDGFDELADRVTYDTVTDHFNTVLSATQGEQAKVVLSSRRQHFLSESQVKLALTERAAQVSGFRLVMLKPFGEIQIRDYLRKTLGDEHAANERYALIDEVKDLLGLSHNPRMLGFIAKIPATKLREAKARTQGEISAADLYTLLVKQWLENEHERLKRTSTQKCISPMALERGVTALALSMWHARAKDVGIEEIRDVLEKSLQGLNEPALDPNVIAFLFASGSLLVRDAEARFSFVHRSVLEWLVAREAAAEVVKGNACATLEADEMSALMADFVIDMAGRDPAQRWAQAVLEENAESRGKTNATMMLVRIEKRWPTVVRVARVPVVLQLAEQDLRGKDLTGVDWRGADLRGANLEGATLVAANLSRANLEGARLYRANLTNAKLSGARLTNADLRVARLLNVDLTGAEGLDSAKFFRTNLARAMVPKGFVARDRFVAKPRLEEWAPMVFAPAMGCHCVTYDPTGELLTAGFADGSVRIFDAESGELLRVLSGHRGTVWSVAFSPDGQSLATGSHDETVRVWDIASGNCLRVLHGHSKTVTSVAYSPDGQSLASASADHAVRVWDAASARCQFVLAGHSRTVSSVAYRPDGTSLASGSTDKTVRVWEVASGNCLRVLQGHSDGVIGVAYSPDGKTLASGSWDKTVRVWDVAAGSCARVLEGHSLGVRSVAYSTDGGLLASCSHDTTVRVWDVVSGDCIRQLRAHSAAVQSVAYSPGGLRIASGSEYRTIRIWDVASGNCIRMLEGHSRAVHSVACSPDGLGIASGSADNTVRVWDVASGTCVSVLEGHHDPVNSVGYHPNSKQLASGSEGGAVRVWDVASGTCVRVLEGHSGVVTGVAYNPDGVWLVSCSSDRTLRVWDAVSAKSLWILKGHSSQVTSVAWSPRTNILASGSSDKTVRVWDAASGDCIRILKGHSDRVRSVAYSPDGSSLASGSSDRTVRVWDVASGNEIHVLQGHFAAVNSVAYDPESQSLASGSEDNTVRVWEVSSGRCVYVLEGHSSAVTSVEFSPDGYTLASGSEDGTLRLWDIASGQCYVILFATVEGWVAFSPDGRYKCGGNIRGSFWHIAGLCRFEPGELPELLLPDDADFRKLSPIIDTL